MKEHPILFTGPMVRAILEGRKTQTRRVIKPQGNIQPGCWDACRFQYHEDGHSGSGWYSWDEGCEDDGSYFFRCPYGRPGDRLWVRETWDFRPWGDGKVRVAYGAGGEQIEANPPDSWNPMLYNYERWRPSIHMPRWASRILLEIVNVRVERVQDISEEDARAEGVYPKSVFARALPRFRGGFYETWDSINSKRGYGWNTNPWVWVIEFEPDAPPSEEGQA